LWRLGFVGIEGFFAGRLGAAELLDFVLKLVDHLVVGEEEGKEDAVGFDGEGCVAGGGSVEAALVHKVVEDLRVFSPKGGFEPAEAGDHLFNDLTPRRDSPAHREDPK